MIQMTNAIYVVVLVKNDASAAFNTTQLSRVVRTKKAFTFKNDKRITIATEPESAKFAWWNRKVFCSRSYTVYAATTLTKLSAYS